MATRKTTFPNQKRRAVGAIIGGVILAAIMVTTVLVYFMTILSNEKAKTSYELEAAQTNQEQAAEKALMVRATQLSGNNIAIRIDNEGSLPLIMSRLLLYCISATCPSPEPDIESPAVTLNGGQSHSRQVGPVIDGRTYRIDVITERGNIVSAKECKVNIGTGVCENDPGGEEEDPECVLCAVNEGIIQGTGSLQLDFKAFGAIYPQLASRAGVDQRGWDTKVSSGYGSATGYPGFELQTVSQGNTQAILVEKARNLDPSGEDLTLNRNTGLLTSNDQVQGTPPPSNYICKEDKLAKTVLPYNEGANSKTLISTAIDADLTEGWEELFFCSTSPGTNSPTWSPTNKFSNLNGIFMIARGTFEDIWAPYAQTVPYQAISLGRGNSNPEGGLLSACLRSSDIATSCLAPTIMDNAASLRYTATQAQMQSGVTVYLHLNTGASLLPNYNVSWLYPYGNFTRLVADAPNFSNPGTRNIEVNLPTTEYDGTTPISCSGGAGTSEYYTLIFTDEFDTSGGASNGKRYTYYMTFRMDC